MVFGFCVNAIYAQTVFSTETLWTMGVVAVVEACAAAACCARSAADDLMTMENILIVYDVAPVVGLRGSVVDMIFDRMCFVRNASSVMERLKIEYLTRPAR